MISITNHAHRSPFLKPVQSTTKPTKSSPNARDPNVIDSFGIIIPDALLIYGLPQSKADLRQNGIA